ncbi:MAG: TolC family protein, partial [Verrucomicrobiota bacterium]
MVKKPTGKNRLSPFLRGALLLFLLSAGGCAVDPSELSDSTVDTGESYRHGGRSKPLLPSGRWWEYFDEPGLIQLIRKLDRDNPSLAVSLARLDRTRAEMGLERTDQFPTITGDAAAERKRDSASGVFVPNELTYNEFRSALNLRWEIDFWGRVRKTVKAAEAEMEAADADWAAARLSLRGELARNYFQLRYLDAEKQLVEDGLALREENLRLVAAQVREGETTELDLRRAETEVEAVRADLMRLERDRASLFNGIAFLCGEVPSQFSLPRGSIGKTPRLPEGLPCELLSRRPDIAAADHRMRAAATRIGVVRA